MRFSLLPLLLCLAAGNAAAAPPNTFTVYTLPAALTSSPFNCTLSAGLYTCPALSLSKATVLRLTSNVSMKINGSFTAAKEFETENNGYTLNLEATGSVALQKDVDATMTLKAGGAVAIAKDAIFNGNITAGGSISFAKDSIYNGNIWADGALAVDKNTVINGTCHAGGGSNYVCQAPVNLLHHLRLNHSGSGVTCTPSPITVNACSSEDTAGTCSTSSSAVSGTVYARSSSGAVLTSANFSIAAGIGAARVSLPVTTAQTATFSVGNLSLAPTNANTCWNNNTATASCSHVYANAAFKFDVPDHVSGTEQTFSVSAVRSTDQAMVCAPAFTDPTPVTLSCGYVNPTNPAPDSAPLPVTINRSAQLACGGAAQSVTLQFDDEGYASTTLTYPDAGRMSLTASYPAYDMTGSAGFVVAPARFVFDSPQPLARAGIALTGATVAGVTIPTTLRAVNANNNVTPNFGAESPAETVTINISKCLPAAGSAGVTSGSVGAFAGGTAPLAGVKWSEAGLAYLTAALTTGNYLNSGLNVTGTTATGIGSCGGAIRFTPAYFTTAITPAQVYSYSGQPITTVRITPYNGDNAITTNYTGALGVAKGVTLSPFYTDAAGTVVAVPAAQGTLSPSAVPAANFKAGAQVGADALPAYTFTPPDPATGIKPAPLQLILRAADDTDGVSSAGHAEASTQIRYGRLRVTNAFGRANGPLTVFVQAQYWTGLSWIINSEDSTTLLPDSAVALTASSASGVSARGKTVRPDGSHATQISAGKGELTLAKANNVAGYVDLAYNLGGTGTDASCLANHPATAGAAVPWLRSLNGCANDYSRDPSARATFGVFSPESKATIHVRELFN
jgi:MSHA biogenesis protein MshQ